MGVRLADIIYPRRCPACHDAVDRPGRLICSTCEGRFSVVEEPTCMRCGKEISDREREYCSDCEKYPKPFSRCFALFNYDDTARGSLLRFKNGGRREYAEYYVQRFMEVRGGQLRSVRADVIVPVPVYSSRRYERGYNQAAEIGRHLSAALSVPMREDLLTKVKPSEQQKGLSAGGRARDIASSLQAAQETAGYRCILLVDDIYTTGSTLSACARVLAKAGAGEVWCAVIAIGSEK
ncbi:MAG: ComF family protein [Lachnospiraceae bacterium]|nr:ComF family protein [Lachnospiraceae bacterium]